MPSYPFTAIVGAQDMALALILVSIAPDIGGVLIRGEKGTAKSTMVRALADVLPPQKTVTGCRFSCDPANPDPGCLDGPHDAAEVSLAAARVIELPVGATEDRVSGSLDLGKALAESAAAFEPGLLAKAHRGVLYVDEVNLLHDHLVDVLLDAAAMGRNTVERDGISVTHPARIVLVGTMNPEEGELRPQLLDRFGLTVELRASREPRERAEVIRRRLAFDADPHAFSGEFAAAQTDLATRLAHARRQLAGVELTDHHLSVIARVCAGFDVDGMRADIVTARAARAHAAWNGNAAVTKADIRAAARFALPHRRRRKPFDAPGLDEELLDQLLDEEPEPPQPDPDGSDDDSGATPQTDTSFETGGSEQTPASAMPSRDAHPELVNEAGDQADGDRHRDEGSAQEPSNLDPPNSDPRDAAAPDPTSEEENRSGAPVAVSRVGQPYRTREFTVAGVGTGELGKRSRAMTKIGRVVAARPGARGRLHIPATIRSAALRSAALRSPVRPARLSVAYDDLHCSVAVGRESNFVLFAVDASGSMAARRRMVEVKTAVLSLLTDAYQRRDRVGLVTFRGSDAALTLHPTSSVDAAAQCLADLPHGGRTPLAEGLQVTARTLAIERIRDRRRRALVIVLTDGRATSGPDALPRARAIADVWAGLRVQTVVVDCETGRMRLGLARELAARMDARHVGIADLGAGDLVRVVQHHRAGRQAA